DRLRSSATLQVTVALPGSIPAELKRAFGPLPSTVPADALYEYVSGRPSGLLAVAVMFEPSPVWITFGFAAQVTCGGRGCLTTTFAVQSAKRFWLSRTVAFTGYVPGCKPLVSTFTVCPVPATLTPVPAQSYVSDFFGLNPFPVAVM